MRIKRIGLLTSSLLALLASAFVVVHNTNEGKEYSNSKPAPPGEPKEAAEAPPVQVFVEKTQIPAGVKYTYRVINGSAFPVTALLIGFDSFHDQPELALLGDDFPPTDRTSPPGWNFNVQPTEEDSLGCIKWEIATEEDQILGGGERGGFSVTLSAEDPAYETVHWTVYLNAAAQSHYYGSLVSGGQTAAPPSSIFAKSGVQVTPNPSNRSFTISFDLPGEGPVTVVIYNVQGRRVAEVPSQRMPSGKASAAWNGEDEKGRRVAPGTYFVRIKSPTVERFARLTWTN